MIEGDQLLTLIFSVDIKFWITSSLSHPHTASKLLVVLTARLVIC